MPQNSQFPGLLDAFTAGAKQIIDRGYTPEQGTPFGSAPYGDNMRDQAMINKGIAYARRHST
jgi:hypothetical protein